MDKLMNTFLPLHLIGIIAIAFSLLISRAEGQLTQQQDVNCPILACCEADCCGPGSLWDRETGYCVASPGAIGFDGTYPSEYVKGCWERSCCEQNCCEDGLLYDATSALCLYDTCGDMYFGYDKRASDRWKMSIDSVKEIYECCAKGAEMDLERFWQTEDEFKPVDTIKFCPGNGISNEGNIYNFTLDDDRTCTLTCNEDTRFCDLSGDGFLSAKFCHYNSDCLTGPCHTSYDILGYCACNCGPDEVCIGCDEYYEIALGRYGGEECEQPPLVCIEVWGSLFVWLFL